MYWWARAEVQRGWAPFPDVLFLTGEPGESLQLSSLSCNTMNDVFGEHGLTQRRMRRTAKVKVWRSCPSAKGRLFKLLLSDGMGLFLLHNLACWSHLLSFPLGCFLPWCGTMTPSVSRAEEWVAFFGTNSHPWSSFTLSSSAASSDQNVRLESSRL